jgi:hypothetical protein
MEALDRHRPPITVNAKPSINLGLRAFDLSRLILNLGDRPRSVVPGAHSVTVVSNTRQICRSAFDRTQVGRAVCSS